MMVDTPDLGRSPLRGSGCQASPSAASADATASSQSGIPNAWRPISDAPRDGRYIIGLSFFTNGEWSAANICRWLTAAEVAENEGWGDASDFSDGWDCEGDEVTPHLWVPFPEIPASAIAAAEDTVGADQLPSRYYLLGPQGAVEYLRTAMMTELVGALQYARNLIGPDEVLDGVLAAASGIVAAEGGRDAAGGSMSDSEQSPVGDSRDAQPLAPQSGPTNDQH